MIDELSSVCPIFINYADGRFEQVGSGVLLQLIDNLFLLSAAHVIDLSEKGTLCIPCNDGINPITGYVSSIYAPLSIDRNNDKLDIAYFKLDKKLASKIHENFNPITRDECWVTDNVLEDDFYSFSGFPLNKTKKRNEKISSEIYSYSGTATKSEIYKKLRYNTNANIIISFNRKKSVNSMGQKVISPHPQGISGGAVFRWPKNIHRNRKKLELHLVGIGHTYLKKHNILIGTRLELYLRFISLRNPTVYQDGDINFSKNNSNVPLFVGLIYYQRDEWPLLMSQFEDAQNMQNTWIEWREGVENGMEYMQKQGKIMIPIVLTAKEIYDYCKSNNLPNIGKTRICLVNQKLIELIHESEIIKKL